MPDPTRQTISATEAGALLGVSPYATKWMLHRRFAEGLDIDKDGDARMSWGKKLEPLVIAQAAQDLALEIRPNLGADGKQIYHRRGLFGATRDATIITPDRGPGACETKCVFDYGVWMNAWDGGKKVPKQIELQLQIQMYVGENGVPFDHGNLPVWVCGEMVYFERVPLPDLWQKLEEEAAAFFENVKAGRAPDPFGDPIEAPFLAMLDRVPDKVIDLSADIPFAEKVRSYQWNRNQINAGNKGSAILKAQLLAGMSDAVEAICYGGIRLKLNRRSDGALTLKPYIPDQLPDDLLDAAKEAELGA